MGEEKKRNIKAGAVISSILDGSWNWDLYWLRNIDHMTAGVGREKNNVLFLENCFDKHFG